MKQWIRDCWDNIRQGLVAAWTAMTPENRSFFTGMGIGAGFGAVLTWLLF